MGERGEMAVMIMRCGKRDSSPKSQKAHTAVLFLRPDRLVKGARYQQQRCLFFNIMLLEYTKY